MTFVAYYSAYAHHTDWWRFRHEQCHLEMGKCLSNEAQSKLILSLAGVLHQSCHRCTVRALVSLAVAWHMFATNQAAITATSPGRLDWNHCLSRRSRLFHHGHLIQWVSLQLGLRLCDYALGHDGGASDRDNCIDSKASIRHQGEQADTGPLLPVIPSCQPRPANVLCLWDHALRRLLRPIVLCFY